MKLMDLRVHIKDDIAIKQEKRSLVGTGIHIRLSQGTEAQIRARSGLAIKYGIGVTNGTVCA